MAAGDRIIPWGARISGAAFLWCEGRLNHLPLTAVLMCMSDETLTELLNQSLAGVAAQLPPMQSLVAS